MKINREKLTHHISRIMCGGQIDEAVFTGTFETKAMTPDHQLLLYAPSIPTKGRSVLLKKSDAPVGVADLGLMVKELGMASGVGNEAVDVEVAFVQEGDRLRLKLNEGERGQVGHLTAQPKVIGTKVEEDTFQQLMAQASQEHGIPLTRVLVDGIRKAFSVYKAQELMVSVGPKGGEVCVGNENTHMYKFPSEELKAPEAYALRFGPHFADVLGTVTNYNEAMLYLSGPDGCVMIDDDGYKYVLMPLQQSADD